MKFPNGPFHKLSTYEVSLEKLLKKDKSLHHLPTIPNFFANQEIFITGATGFVGKVLIEKLLRSCPDIKTIYVLMRTKKGQSIKERLKTLCDQILFDGLRAINPNFMNKIVPIEGDVSELGLGLSNEDKNLMKNISIIYHSAASVRFDDTLKYSVMMNTRGTREIMEFALTLTNLKVVMHVSTGYANIANKLIKEELYPPLADWQKTIEICEKLDEQQLDSLAPKYTNFMPNTYVFSKNIAEHVVHFYKDKLPLIIFRPTIILSAFEEPYAGYVRFYIPVFSILQCDNFNGPLGILLASHVGISKTMHCDPKNCMDLLPVDICVKGMIIATWKRAYEPSNGELPIINAASSKLITVTINQLLDIGINGLCEEFPIGDLTVTVPSGGVTLCPTWNLIRAFYLQIIPAVAVDTMLRIKKKKPRVMRIQRKIFEANKALTYFVTHNWTFLNDKFLELSSCIKPEDLRSFEFKHFYQSSALLFIRQGLYGYRRYLMNIDDTTLEADRKKFRIMKIITNFFTYSIYFYLFYYVFIVKDILSYLR